MIGALVLRPEPGNSRTAEQLQRQRIDVLRQPLFAIAPVAWDAPDPMRFDALLLTSGNAVRHGGGQIARLVKLPVVAVGAATATEAKAAGLDVILTGERDAAGVTARAKAEGLARLLHLAGRDRVEAPGVEAITIYRSEVLPVAADAVREWQGRVALLHSARAARRFAELLGRDGVARDRIAVAALSAAVLEAAGSGWAFAAVADIPTDAALVARAAALIDPPGAHVDKQAR